MEQEQTDNGNGAVIGPALLADWGPAPDVPLDDVLWRIDSKGFEQSSSETGYVARYVPYLNASKVAALLDAWVGPLNWRDRYEAGELAGAPVLWCHLEIRRPGIRQVLRTGDGAVVDVLEEIRIEEWIRKSDAGVAPGNSGSRGRGEGLSEKGIVSDAFKRAACLKWGAGRNVYDLPTIWGPAHVQGSDTDKVRAPAGVEAYLVAQLRARGFQVDSATPEGARAEQETADLSPGSPPTGPVEPAHACPKCGSPVVDQRRKAEADTTHRTPSWVCRNQACNGGNERKSPRAGQSPNWPWSSWDTNEFTPPVDPLSRANWDAKRRILEKAGGDEGNARAAWGEAASDLGKGPDDILEVPDLAVVEVRAGELVVELLSIEVGPPEAPDPVDPAPEREPPESALPDPDPEPPVYNDDDPNRPF